MYSHPETFSCLCVGVWLDATAWRTIYTCMFPCADRRWYTVCVCLVTAGDFLRRCLTQRCSHCSHHFSVAPLKKTPRDPESQTGGLPLLIRPLLHPLNCRNTDVPGPYFQVQVLKAAPCVSGGRANMSHVKDRWRRRQRCARVCASVCLCVFIPMTTKMKTCTSLRREPNKGWGGFCHWAGACSTISLMS